MRLLRLINNYGEIGWFVTFVIVDLLSIFTSVVLILCGVIHAPILFAFSVIALPILVMIIILYKLGFMIWDEILEDVFVDVIDTWKQLKK